MKKNESFILHATSGYHPNRAYFKGVLATTNRIIESPPSGSRGHKVILDSNAVKDALPSLVGMAVNFDLGYSDHDKRRKCGVITYAKLYRRKILVEGYLYGKDFPDLIHALKKAEKPFGMSYEIASAHVENMLAEVWKVIGITFTGAAILYLDKAADKKTSFELSAAN